MDDDDAGDAREADEEHEDLVDPELAALEARIIIRTPAWKISALVVTCALIIGSGLAAWVMKSRLSGLPALDEQAARELGRELDVLRELPPHRRRGAAGRALGAIETERLPAPLIVGLVDGGRQSEWVRLATLRAALLDPEVLPLWRDLCGADFDLEETSRTSRSGMRVYERCGLHRFELLSASHVVTSHAEEVLAAHAIFRHLHDEDALTEVEERALRLFGEGTVEAAPALPFH